MSPSHRRLAAAAVAGIVMVAAAAGMRPGEQPERTLRITFGHKDRTPTDWSGRIDVQGGTVAALSGWRFEAKDAVDGTAAWKCRTRNQVAPGARFPLTAAPGQPARETPQAPWPVGLTVTLRGANPPVTLTLPQGEVKFAADVLLGEPQTFLDGQVRVERLPETTLLRPPAPPKTPDAVQDDYPAFWIRYRTNKHYLAWVAYQKGKDRVLLVERDGPTGAWSQPMEVAGPGDHFRVALATLHDDTLWIVWSSQRRGDWDLYGRPYKEGQLGNEVRLTEASGPDLWHRMTTDRFGRAWLVWQGFRDGRSTIFARWADDKGWHDTIQVSDGKSNNWDPCIAADYREDRVWVGWDTYDQDNYTIRVRSLSREAGATPGPVLTPSITSAFGAHASLACDREGRLWVAWDEAGSQWGKDTGYLYRENNWATGLYRSRHIRIRVLADGKWREPREEFTAVSPQEMKEANELPLLQEDGEGRMWLAFRHRTCWRPREDDWAAQGRWDVFATAYVGDRWLPPVELPRSAGRNDMRASSQRDRSGSVYFAYASDNRGPFPPAMGPRNLSVTVTRLSGAPKASEAGFKPADPFGSESVRRTFNSVHPREAEQVARIRNYKIEAGGKTYRIYRGDLHRHTDISPDGVGDGSIMDLHRYALDAAALDFVLIADHNMGGDNEYCWWRTQKANDLYTVPGAFISMYGYERSVPYPNGHRNVIWAERGHRTLPLPQGRIPAQMAADTGRLYAYLRQTNGICTLHTSATDQGTNWEEHDNTLEPIVELFQGFHTSYEAPGAPKTTDDKTDLVHGPYRPDGFVSTALEKGYRLGFQASSDHVSTHVSYACVLAEEFSRNGLVEAMRRRHTYAATDNIVLDVRLGTLGIMGDEVRTSQPRFEVVVLGTGPVERVEVLRNGQVAHTERPAQDAAEVRFHWEDPAPRKGDKPSYYYVRVQQKDGQMAWASPIWVHVGS
jgi:hypothetical protein